MGGIQILNVLTKHMPVEMVPNSQNINSNSDSGAANNTSKTDPNSKLGQDLNVNRNRNRRMCETVLGADSVEFGDGVGDLGKNLDGYMGAEVDGLLDLGTRSSDLGTTNGLEMLSSGLEECKSGWNETPTSTSMEVSDSDVEEEEEELVVLGQGKFGQVVLDEENDVAVKLVDALDGRREIDIMRRLDHPFVVKYLGVYATEERDQFWCIQMEFCQGGDLFNLTREMDLTMEMVRFYLLEIAIALQYVHNQGVIHGDLKLENIMLGYDGHIRLIDFGLSSFVTAPVCGSGTLHYAAPEMLFRHLDDIGSGIDWWSFGVLAHEMMFHHLPWNIGDSRLTTEEVCRRICFVQLDLPSMNVYDRDGFDLCKRMLRKNIRDRLHGLGPIAMHPFFVGLTVGDLERKLIAPPLCVV